MCFILIERPLEAEMTYLVFNIIEKGCRFWESPEKNKHSFGGKFSLIIMDKFS